MSEELECSEEKGDDEEALFSLEVVVEKLIAPGVVCRFPAVAFRLLDYPTLLTYHVEPELAEVIKKKLAADPHYKVPPQIQELKDRDGYFMMKKGKSCLLKVCPRTLHAHLMNTPLYAMLIDTFTEVPKLIGNCGIPLDEIMDLVYKDINHFGISVPSAHGKRGEYKMYNLMGHEIGKVTLGYRLVSLGRALVPHLTDDEKINNTISEKENACTVRSSSVNKALNLKKSGMDTVTAKILSTMETMDKDVQVVSQDFMPMMEHTDTQTDKINRILRSSGIQTDKQRCKSRKKKQRKDPRQVDPYTKVSNELNDFMISNTVCPPPLFYNSEALDPMKDALTFDDQGVLCVQRRLPARAWQESLSDSSDPLSDETIRQEDKFSDSDIEEVVDFQEKRVAYNRKEKKRALCKEEAHRLAEVDFAQQAVQALHGFSSQSGAKSLHQLPLLHALLKEIMTLNGLEASGLLTGQVAGQASRQVGPRTSPKRHSSATKLSEEREEHLRKLATPRMSARSGRPESPTAKSHRVCAEESRPVPKNKSWISNHPELAVPMKPTKLTYGMTNAQRLRLAKTNPDLLAKLEKQQRERVERSQQRTRAKYSQYKREAEIGERLMHREPPTSRRSTATSNLAVDVAASLESTDGQGGSRLHRSHRRPVPTPRRSLSMKSETMKAALEQLDRQELGHTEEYVNTSDTHHHEPGFPTPVKREKTSPTEEQTQRHQQQSMISSQHAASRSHTKRQELVAEMDKQNESTPVGGFGSTQTLFNPGFPAEQPPSSHDQFVRRPESRLTDHTNYSEDFEDGMNTSRQSNGSGTEPSLRKVVEHYSDDSDSQRTDISAAEPSLRKIVDHYSDDSQASGASGLEPSLKKVVDYYPGDSSGSDSDRSVPPLPAEESVASRTSVMSLKIPAVIASSSSSVPNPMASLLSPVAAMRPTLPPTAEGLAASSTPTESDRSTAYLRESQLPTLSETAGSYDPGDTGNTADWTGVANLRQGPARPRPSPRRGLERMSSVHTESVSSYAPSDGENQNMSSGDEENYTESFDEESEEEGPSPVKQMSDLRLAPEAKMGYTWGYSKN